MSVDANTVLEGLMAFYLSANVLAALVGTVPGALVEKKTCATLERFHFLLFFFGGMALLGFLYFEIARSVAALNLWKAQLGMSLALGLYLGNVTARRLRNAGKRPLLALLIWLPGVNAVFLVALAFLPTAPKKRVSQSGPLPTAQAV